MNKDFVPHEEALALKELGFDEECFAGYFNYVSDNPERATQLLAPKDSIFGENYMFKNSVDFIKMPSMAINHHPIVNKNCAAPLYQQAFRWFREKHSLIGLVEGGYDKGKNIFTYVIWDDFKDEVCEKYFSSYEEAELVCLKKLTKIVKSKK